MKILLTDDMVSMRHILLHMLRNLGYTDIDEAVDGDQAFTMLHQKQYDLLVPKWDRELKEYEAAFVGGGDDGASYLHARLRTS